MKKAYYYTDDTIWLLRDITREKPASIFDNPYLKMIKTAHDRFGLKVQFNLFYRTDSYYGYDEFSLADVTDAYKEEFKANSDWLKFAFHALEEFPDYPHVNATYDDTKKLFKMIEKEVFRFAGEDSFAYTVCPHWLPLSKDAVRALVDCGVKLLDCTVGDPKEYNGDPASLPYGHAGRLLNNRQPETRVFSRGGRDTAIANSICGYNHYNAEVDAMSNGNDKIMWDSDMGVFFKKYCNTCLNTTPYDELEEECKPLADLDYIGICNHEQYFYADYFAYQPDHAEKLFKMCEILKGYGFEFVCGEELLKGEKVEWHFE